MALAKIEKYKCFVSYLILGVLKLKNNMIVGKILKFATKPEHFLAQFVQKLCRNKHSWSKLASETGSQKSADSGSSSKMEKNDLRKKKSTPREKIKYLHKRL